MPTLPSLGALLTTDIESHDLGTFDGRRLVGRTQRRSLRIAVGDRTALRCSLTRLRPVAIEVEELNEAGRRYEVPVRTPADPMLRSAGRIAALQAGALATRLLARPAVAALVANRRTHRPDAHHLDPHPPTSEGSAT